MNVTRTGFDSAPLIPVGAVVAEAYWVAPHGYVNPGDSYPTKDLALEASIVHMKNLIVQHEAFYRKSDGHLPENYLPLPESITVEYRWTLRHPAGALDAPILREVYATLADAEEALVLYNRFSPLRRAQ